MPTQFNFFNSLPKDLQSKTLSYLYCEELAKVAQLNQASNNLVTASKEGYKASEEYRALLRGHKLLDNDAHFASIITQVFSLSVNVIRCYGFLSLALEQNLITAEQAKEFSIDRIVEEHTAGLAYRTKFYALLCSNGLTALREELINFEQAKLLATHCGGIHQMYSNSLSYILSNNGLILLRASAITSNIAVALTLSLSDSSGEYILYLLSESNEGVSLLNEDLITAEQINDILTDPKIRLNLRLVLENNGRQLLKEKRITVDQIMKHDYNELSDLIKTKNVAVSEPNDAQQIQSLDAKLSDEEPSVVRFHL